MGKATHRKKASTRAESWPKLAMLSACPPGSLVRVSATEWALKGTTPEIKLEALLVLTKAGVSNPFFFDLTEKKEITEQLPVLSYGRRYTLLPDHSGGCELVSGPLLDTSGSFILSDVGRFVQARWRGEGGALLYYNVDTGQVEHQVPFQAGHAAAFERWNLWLDPPAAHRPNGARESVSYRVVDVVVKPRKSAQPPDQRIESAGGRRQS